MPSYAKNKKAYHDYEVLETFEVGIALNGDEVKSIKLGQANLKGSYVDVEEIPSKRGPSLTPFLNEAHVSRYKNSSRLTSDPTRKRKLILHKKEIAQIAQAITQKGTTCIALELYSKQGLIKLKIGLCRGKKLYDKRKDLKRKDQDMEVNRALKRYQ